jgi:hypothetical protein
MSSFKMTFLQKKPFPQETSIALGSLLDDNNFHDVVISRDKRDLVMAVDRVQVHTQRGGVVFCLSSSLAQFFPMSILLSNTLLNCMTGSPSSEFAVYGSMYVCT